MRGGRSGSQKARRVSEEAVRQCAYPRRAEAGKEGTAEVYIGEERLGDLDLDDEDDDLSYNFRMEIDLGEVADIDRIKRLDAYLKRKFDSTAIRVVPRPKKRDSLEIYVGEEFIGVLFVDDEKRRGGAYILEMPILDMDLA